jgi:hypothetical protein
VVGVGLEDDVGLLRRLKREFGYFCLELFEEQEVGLAIGGHWHPKGDLSSVEMYDSASSTWCEVAPMSQGRRYPGACVVDGAVYVTGGYNTDEGVRLSSVERYCPASDMWTSGASMPTRRCAHCTCAVGNYMTMYVLGGDCDGVLTSSVLKYEVGSDSWSEVAPMPEAVVDSTACVLGDMIYVFGGRNNDDDPVGTVYKYDVGADEWSTCTPMPEPRYHSRACSMGNMMYVVGGKDEGGVLMGSLFRYDPVSDSWSELAPMQAEMSSFGLYVLEEYMHAFDRSHAFVYDSSADSWSIGQGPNTPRDHFQACTVKVEVDLFDAMIVRAQQRRARYPEVAAHLKRLAGAGRGGCLTRV